MLIENSAFCNSCFDIVTSRKPTERKWCSCREVLVSGGIEEPRLSGDCMDLSWELDSTIINKCINAIKKIDDKQEIVLEVLRVLRQAERIIADGEPIFIAEYNNEFLFTKNGEYVTYPKEKANV